MRKCLLSWCNGSFNFQTKLRGSDIELLNIMLESCEKNRPNEIQRNIRGVKYLKYWKGTEYRVMLLYLGIVVLKDVLIKEIYEHFLLLSCAVTILSCNTYNVYVDIAKALLEEYLEGCINIYGVDSISSNFHNLCHVIDDVKKFGALPGISAYQFENSLGQLKSLVRSGKQPLKQIAHWVTRQSNTGNKSDAQEFHLKGEIKDAIYRKIYLKDFMLGRDDKNSWFLTKNNDIVKLQNVSLQEGNILITGKQLENQQDFFTLPFKSSKLNIFSADYSKNQSMASEEPQHEFLLQKQYNLTEIKCKLFCLTYRNKSVFLPLLHTLDCIKKS